MTDLLAHISGQRRRSTTGRKLHCCCVCNQLAPWGKSWSWYGSWKEIDDNVPVMKFCSERCRKQQKAVTIKMCEEARQKEFIA